jgi:glycosyltransferase involved in cell wall biosynthesis
MRTRESSDRWEGEQAERGTALGADGVLYFGNDWSGENRTSSHHIASHLARANRLVYVESPGLRAPRASGRDLRKILAKLRTFASGPRNPEPGVVVGTLLQLPFHGSPYVRRLNRELVLASARSFTRSHGIRRPIAWFTVPHLAPVVGRLGEALCVYYCVDDYARLPDVDVAAVRRLDDEMTRKADVVFVTSETMLAEKRRLNPHTYASPHGVDFEHFSKASDPATPASPELAHIKGPIVGFFGLIEAWIDLDLVAQLADLRPEWTFVMIGRVAVPASQVPRRPNLLFLGQQPYGALPSFGRRFDVALYPVRDMPVVQHMNPIKLREYMAMGVPIVASRTPNTAAFSDVVHTARTSAEFLALLDAVIDGPPDPERAHRQMAIASTMTWAARVREVASIVRDRLAQVNKGGWR